MPEGLVQEYLLYDNSDKELASQIRVTVRHLLEAGFTCMRRKRGHICNTFYFKPKEDIVFAVYYNKKSKVLAYTTMDLDVFDEFFRYTDKTIALLFKKNKKKFKVAVYLDGKYTMIYHLAVKFDRSKYECVDHIYSNLCFNHRKALQQCSQYVNNLNRCNSKCKETTYNASRDFRKNWWLLVLAELGYITMEEAMDYNKSLQ